MCTQYVGRCTMYMYNAVTSLINISLCYPCTMNAATTVYVLIMSYTITSVTTIIDRYYYIYVLSMSYTITSVTTIIDRYYYMYVTIIMSFTIDAVIE